MTESGDRCSTYQARNINAILLVATTQGKVDIELIEAVLGVAFGNGLSRGEISNWAGVGDGETDNVH